MSLSQADSGTFYLVTLPASLENRIREPRHGRVASAEVPSRAVAQVPETWFAGEELPFHNTLRRDEVLAHSRVLSLAHLA